MRKANITFLTLVLLFCALYAEFELRSLTISITLNPDGTAHAVEEARLFITGEQSINLYQQSRVFNDLSTWINRTGISDLRTHASRAYVELSELQVRSESVDSCNNIAQTCYATLVLDYDVYPINNQSSGIVDMDMYKPRTTKFSLRNEVFAFNRSKTDDIILSQGTSIEITVPDEATRLTFSKVPDNFDEAEKELFRFDSKTGNNYYVGNMRNFVWSGQTLSQFGMSYEIEQSLEEEITRFFSYLQKKIFDTLFSYAGIAYILATLSILLSFIWLHSLESK
ncbi:MAG: hypothetical protein ABIH83_03805 [Candidatus Micrarchaeota archaeon]